MEGAGRGRTGTARRRLWRRFFGGAADSGATATSGDAGRIHVHEVGMERVMRWLEFEWNMYREGNVFLLFDVDRKCNEV